MRLREKVCRSNVTESFHNRAMPPLLRILKTASMELKPISFFIGSISCIDDFVSMRNKTVGPFDCILKDPYTLTSPVHLNPYPAPLTPLTPNFTLPTTPTISSRSLNTNKRHPPTLDDLIVVVAHLRWMISPCSRLWSRSHSGRHRSELWPPLGWMISSAW
ncbi:hypothetical protein CMV_017085 [Castanea mollissima]|uniref:Uncharacterized protein n=1 Tax=Castanea mollissima TaxID=60419 RepID=A0A8J4R5D5_9ROSI|nr:hypothetical protein CMV_017085 [Castanea mollissima]